MFANIINSVKGFISTLNPFLGLILIFLLGLFVFWKESSRSRKNNSSVFDIFFISVIIGILVGRLVYVISNWSSEYSSLLGIGYRMRDMGMMYISLDCCLGNFLKFGMVS